MRLVPLGSVDGEVLRTLRRGIAGWMRAPVAVAAALRLRPEWFDPRRDQYRADLILDALVADRGGTGDWSIGVLDADLFVPGFNYVFGQATVRGCCGVIGLARLRPEFEKAPGDRETLLQRALTEAVHELGHIAGLAHCADPTCVMHFSPTARETDLKGPGFCDRCRSFRA